MSGEDCCCWPGWTVDNTIFGLHVCQMYCCILPLFCSNGRIKGGGCGQVLVHSTSDWAKSHNGRKLQEREQQAHPNTQVSKI